jgi:hypothetical protein
MDKRTLIDEMHLLAEGSLPPEDETRLRSRCEANPELRQLLEQILEVHALTEIIVDAEPPACRLTFEDLERTFALPRARRTVLPLAVGAVAAVLVLTVGAFFLARVLTGRPHRPDGGETGRALVLSAIPLERTVAPGAGSVPDADPEVLTVLADYQPLKDEQIQWIDSFATATAMARVSSRPVLLFLHHPTCPWCIEMREDTFTHEAVLSRVDGFVPAMISVMDLDPVLRPLLKEGWPWSGVVDADGTTILSFPGLKGPGQFSAQLQEAAGLTPRSAFDWESVNRLAGLALDARKAEEGRRYGDAYRTWSQLKADPDSGPFARVGEAGVHRIGIHALSALTSTRDLASTKKGATSAVDLLSAEVERFADTPYAADLALVRDRLLADGEFPRIAGLD